MSVFKSASPDSLKDFNQVRDYILSINKAVQNVFNSLDPDDNFTGEELNRYNEIGKKIAMAEVSSSGLRILFTDLKEKTGSEIEETKRKLSLKVRSGDLVNQLNLERGDINISGNRLEIVTNNFIVTGNRMYARGNITATGGSFGGWTIANGSWNGNRNSRINVSSINADSGSARTVRAHGPVKLKATAMGNFDTIDFTGSTLSGGFTCSCMEEMGNTNAWLRCERLYAYTTYRSPGEGYPPSKPQHPDEAPYPGSKVKDYNENPDPTGGVLTGSVSCYSVTSSMCSRTWSDQRLKKNITPVSEDKARDLLDRLIPSTFTLKNDQERMNGFIAQEVPEEYRVVMKNGFYGLKYRSISTVLDVELKKYTLTLNNELYEAEKCVTLRE